MQKQRLQVFPKDDGKLNNVQKKGLSILLWVKRERRYTTAVTVRPEAEKTWTGDAAADNWDRILDFGGHCDAAASCAAADNVILSFANGMTYEVWRGDKTFPEARQRLSVNLPFPPGEWVHVAVLHDMTENTAFIFWNQIPVASGQVHLPRAGVERPSCLIGRSNFVGDPIFRGMMKDLFVYETCIDRQEMKTVVDQKHVVHEVEKHVLGPHGDADVVRRERGLRTLAMRRIDQPGGGRRERRRGERGGARAVGLRQRLPGELPAPVDRQREDLLQRQVVRDGGLGAVRLVVHDGRRRRLGLRRRLQQGEPLRVDAGRRRLPDGRPAEVQGEVRGGGRLVRRRLVPRAVERRRQPPQLPAGLRSV